jgi:putative salt-induced outer membrane protein YdiY
MRELFCRVWLMPFLLILAAVPAAEAQAPATAPPPPPDWTGSAGFGLSLSRGNTTTTNLNASFEATRHPKTADVWAFKGLYLRGQNNGALAVDRLSLDARNERNLGARAYAFGNVQFLRDTFKDIDYLVAPGVGLGYKLVATPQTTFNVDAGLGVKIEKDTIPAVTGDPSAGTSTRRTDAVVTASDKIEYKLSKTAALSQTFSALWKAQDFGDALYTLTAGAAAALTPRTQLKVELLDSYASRPPAASVQSNDVALLTALVYKF